MVYDVVVYGDSCGAVTAVLAAGLALDSKTSVQNIAYPALREKLDVAKQIMDNAQVPKTK